MHGQHGAMAEINLPAEVFDPSYDSLHLDFALGCPGSRDVDCPIWDHVVQLFVCCDDIQGSSGEPCEPCPTTVWVAADPPLHNNLTAMDMDHGRMPGLVRLPQDGLASAVRHGESFLGAWQASHVPHVLQAEGPVPLDGNDSRQLADQPAGLLGELDPGAHQKVTQGGVGEQLGSAALNSGGMAASGCHVHSLDLLGQERSVPNEQLLCGRELGRWITPFRQAA